MIFIKENVTEIFCMWFDVREGESEGNEGKTKRGCEGIKISR